MTNILETSAAITILIAVIGLLILWIVIRTAVKSGTKSAIMECYNEITKIENNPELKANITKSIEDETREELENW